ncbi:hypothetical protein IB211_03112c [Intestinimonas butyriciproducens]|uniref:Uncharacterized protein n=1 Tax=Intestinimonas butyriciproducens TaxID=1297617 RepID=A0A0S2W877_9FIRM|nr:hypothetical protein IB211_03112c [Intestinimonas butyriciproducens]QBB67222.1 hypothetical protein SRB521_02965 [Intestinimonas butyriciproducens]
MNKQFAGRSKTLAGIRNAAAERDGRNGAPWETGCPAGIEKGRALLI